MRKHNFFEVSAHIKGRAEEKRPSARLQVPAPERKNGGIEQAGSQAFPLSHGLSKLRRESPLPRLLGLFGGAVLAAGAGAPLIYIPIAGTISYFRHPSYFTSCNIGELVIL